MTKIDRQLEALTAMPPAQLREEWLTIVACEPPSVSDTLFRKLLAYRLQEQRYGGVPSAVVRELKRKPASGEEASRPAIEVRPGTRFVREWNGQTISVEALDHGFAWNDRHYASLSAIARKVTGAHWSGPRFFGLTSRAK